MLSLWRWGGAGGLVWKQRVLVKIVDVVVMCRVNKRYSLGSDSEVYLRRLLSLTVRRKRSCGQDWALVASTRAGECVHEATVWRNKKFLDKSRDPSLLIAPGDAKTKPMQLAGGAKPYLYWCTAQSRINQPPRSLVPRCDKLILEADLGQSENQRHLCGARPSTIQIPPHSFNMAAVSTRSDCQLILDADPPRQYRQCPRARSYVGST